MRTSTSIGLALLGFLALAGGCANRPEPFMGSSERGQMLTHFDLALEARDRAIVGDVPGFRAAAEDLDELRPARDLPQEIWLQLGPMRWEAREASDAATVEEAALGAAEIARTCGECHEANDVDLGSRFTLGGPPPGGSERRHMAGLAWASRLLWDGLVGPSDRTWLVGGEGLVELGALPEGMEARIPPDEVETASRRLRELGRAAAAAETADRRVAILGDVWTACAGCHQGRLHPR